MTNPYYKYLIQWDKEYAAGCGNDKQAVEIFVHSEGYEAVNSLRNELLGVKAGRFIQDTLKAQFGSRGEKRVQVHGDFTEWASIMLQWLNFYKNRG